MKRTIILLFLLLGLAATGYCDALDTRIRKEAIKLANAIIAQDWNTVVSYSYPAVVQRIGGKENMIKILQNGSNQMSSQGISYEKIEIEKPLEKKNIKKTIYAMVPQKITMNISGGYLYQKSYLIGISKNESQHWYFLDTAQLNDENLKSILPDLAGKMKIPQREQPIFEKK